MNYPFDVIFNVGVNFFELLSFFKIKKKKKKIDFVYFLNVSFLSTMSVASNSQSKPYNY